MSEKRYINAAQQRVLKLLSMLSGHEVQGLAPSELAKAAHTSASNITRDLANLREAGMAEPIEDSGRWRLTPRVAQMALRVLNELDRAKQRVEEVTQRYTRAL